LERFFINGNSYIAGEVMTLADFSVWSTLLVLDLLFPIDDEKFPKLRAYLKMLEQHPNFEINNEGAKKQVDLIDKCMEKAKNYHINRFELIYPRPI
jgi:glutathione S-transferase